MLSASSSLPHLDPSTTSRASLGAFAGVEQEDGYGSDEEAGKRHWIDKVRRLSGVYIESSNAAVVSTLALAWLIALMLCACLACLVCVTCWCRGGARTLGQAGLPGR